MPFEMLLEYCQEGGIDVSLSGVSQLIKQGEKIK